MILNNAGVMIQKWWQALGERFDIGVEPYVIMPNHIHGIVTISNNENHGNLDVFAKNTMSLPLDEAGENIVSPLPTPRRLGQYVSWFKRMSTNEYIRGVKNNNWPQFNKRIWQRDFWEHIIRCQTELDNIKKYINNNPQNWAADKLCT